MTRRARKHKDWTLAQWPDDLSTNLDALSNPYPCQSCKKPCKSIQSLRTHKCAVYRKGLQHAA